MIIDCISDLHGHYPELPGGDLLIVAGDITCCDMPFEYDEFINWMQIQEYSKKVVIAGNHDAQVQKGYFEPWSCYLQDSGTEFQGLKIWGSPWTLKFEGQNPNAMAFTCDTEEELAEKWDFIPDDTNILITHSPAGVLGYVNSEEDRKGAGSCSLWCHLRLKKNKIKLHVFGHIHECGGMQCIKSSIHGEFICVNASHVDEHYKPRKPGYVRVEL